MWIAKQMRDEGDVMAAVPPRCYWCNAKGPGLYWLPSEEGVIEMAVWNCLPCITQTGRLRPPLPDSTDLLRAVVAAWDDWTRDDAAITWERQMDAVIEAAREHLNPKLPEGAS